MSDLKIKPADKARLRNHLYERDGRTCHYCGIAERDFLMIWGEFYGSKRRGSTLEVDRKDNNRGYEIDNCVLACAVCNNAKSDKFSYDEFISVGKIITQVWKERLRTHE
jgi:5-methylcytosine-specific restriction endonuclease McrA